MAWVCWKRGGASRSVANDGYVEDAAREYNDVLDVVVGMDDARGVRSRSGVRLMGLSKLKLNQESSCPASHASHASWLDKHASRVGTFDFPGLQVTDHVLVARTGLLDCSWRPTDSQLGGGHLGEGGH